MDVQPPYSKTIPSSALVGSTHEIQLSIDHRLLVWAGGAVRWRSLQRVALAAALPWPLLLSLQTKGVLWWAAPQLRHRLDKVRVVRSRYDIYRMRHNLWWIHVPAESATYARCTARLLCVSRSSKSPRDLFHLDGFKTNTTLCVCVARTPPQSVVSYATLGRHVRFRPKILSGRSVYPSCPPSLHIYGVRGSMVLQPCIVMILECLLFVPPPHHLRVRILCASNFCIIFRSVSYR